ncbi:MAG: nicotinate-nucleotide adenylyltransferase [Pseudohongiellaceae bacterium]|jgi:nicotinate-nucleotide adenylyltransferase
MAELAVAEHEHLCVDSCELQRDQLSFTVDTLEHLREEYGEDSVLCWAMGTDAFASISSWHRWQEILAFAHIIVLARPGETLPLHGEVAHWLQRHQLPDVKALREKSRGGILLQNLTPYPISATSVRRAIKESHSVAHHLPAAVLNYIEQHKLYGSH